MEDGHYQYAPRSTFRTTLGSSVGSKLNADGAAKHKQKSETILTMGGSRKDDTTEEERNRDLKTKIRCVSCATLTIFFVTLILIVINFGFTVKLWSLAEQIHKDLNDMDMMVTPDATIENNDVVTPSLVA